MDCGLCSYVLCSSCYCNTLNLLNLTRRVAVYLQTHCNIGSEGVSHQRTRQVTQLFTYLLTQRRIAATPTSVCLFLRHNSARRPRWPLTIAENLGRYLSGTYRTAQGRDFELILTVKMKTRYPVGGLFGRELSAFVIIAELWRPQVAKPGNFVSTFLRFFGKTIPLKLSLLRGPRPKSARASPHIWLTLFQILSKSVHFHGVIAERVKTVFAP